MPRQVSVAGAQCSIRALAAIAGAAGITSRGTGQCLWRPCRLFSLDPWSVQKSNVSLTPTLPPPGRPRVAALARLSLRFSKRARGDAGADTACVQAFPGVDQPSDPSATPHFRADPRLQPGSGRTGGLITLVALAILLPVAKAVRGQGEGEAPRTEWSLEAGLGFEYDTNVSVDEVDLSSGQSDYATTADLKLGMRHRLTDRTQAAMTYDLSSSNYREFSRVDRVTQILGGDISTQLGKSSAGLSAYLIDSRLDGEPFLRFVRLSPSLSGFTSQRWFARGAYVYSERDINQRARRNAQTHSAEGDLYYFHRGLRSYFNLGYRYRDEDAVADELDFRAHSLKLRYLRRFDLWKRQAKAEIALRYEVRDYLFDEPTIDERRRDDRLRWKLDFEIPVSARLTWQAYYSYGDYVSNLPRADFIQTIVGTRLQFTW